MATDTPELTQIEPSEARSAAPHSTAPLARTWQEKLGGDGSPAAPLLQLALAAGTVLVIATGAVLCRASLVPPPPVRIQAVAALQPAKPRPLLAAVAPAAVPAPATARAASPTLAAAAAPTPPVNPAAVPAAAPPEPPAARRVEVAPKSHGKKPHRPPTSTRKRASMRPAAPAATKARRSAS